MRALEPDWWIELENTYATRIAQRQELYREHGKGVLDWLPGSEPACKELMEMVLLFLVNRYPMYFSLVRSKPSLAAPDVFVNGILGTESKLKEVNPLCVLLDHVPEDFAITLKNQETGLYEFRAGVICSALGWDVSTKIGKNLTQIHEIVPDYKENMQKHMDQYVLLLELTATVGFLFLTCLPTATSLACFRGTQSSGAPGASSVDNRSTCRPIIPATSCGPSRTPPLPSRMSFCGLIGRRCDDCRCLLVLSSTSKPCLLHSLSCATSRLFPSSWQRS